MAALALSGWTAAGCGATARGTSPRGVLAEVSVAARAGDAAALYALLPEAARRAEPFEAFRTRVTADHGELVTLAERVTRTLAHRSPQVDVGLSGGDAVAAQDDPDGWSVARAGIGPAVATTPDDAVRALHQALTRRSLGGVLEALSARARGSMEAELAALADATADPASLEHTMVPDQVTLRLPDGRFVVLRREDGIWRVDDLRDEH